MECTQRLEYTQELYDTNTEKTCPEQIGFLGINGTKHPVKKGPNKIGRDPTTCSIVLNLNSVSRHHAVINIMNSREFMLMDLDSANKTKLQNKTLPAYIPHPLKNGDMVQFGDIFGVFRLLEEDDELPMTQAVDIPETPAPSKPVLKLNRVPITLIPESPDVSDREDSFITLSKEKKLSDSQPKNEIYKLSNSQFITSFGKSLPIEPVSSPKVGLKQTTRKSSSISFIDNPNTSLNELITLPRSDNIHELDTQPPQPINESTDSIYTDDTQMPEAPSSPSIHSLDTQMPAHLPQVQKNHNQQDMQFEIYAANKENDISIFNADTQPFPCEKKDSVRPKDVKDTKLPDEPPNDKSLAISDEELLFDDVDGEVFEEDFHSQALLPPELPFVENVEESHNTNSKIAKDTQKETSKFDLTPSKRDARTQSEGSTDCEDFDILPTQKIPALPSKEAAKKDIKLEPLKRPKRIKSDSSTDCEDIDMIPTQKIPELTVNKQNKAEPIKVEENKAIESSKKINRIDSDSTDCEDFDMMLTQKIPEKKPDIDDDLTDCEDETDLNKSIQPKLSKSDDVQFEDMATQIVDIIAVDHEAFEDMPTQVIEIINKNVEDNEDDVPTQVIDRLSPNNFKANKEAFKEFISPFKIPLQSTIKVRSREIPKLAKGKIIENKRAIEEEDNYYAATQDIYQDLCSERATSPEIVKSRPKGPIMNSNLPEDDEMVPCSDEDYKICNRFANITKDLSPIKYVVADKSSSSDGDERLKTYLSHLSSPQVREIIGVDKLMPKLKRMPSDSSDVDISTPTKVRPLKFSDTDLPNSQEIKTSVSLCPKLSITEYSSDSDTENNTEEQYTPILHRKKIKPVVTKIDLTKKFDVEKLPEKVLTRVRVPTLKRENFLKPRYLVEQEDQIDKDILIENITRLKNEKAKGKDTTRNEKFEDRIGTNARKGINNDETKKKISEKGNGKEMSIDKRESGEMPTNERESKEFPTVKETRQKLSDKRETRQKPTDKPEIKQKLNNKRDTREKPIDKRQTKEKIKVKIEKPKKKESKSELRQKSSNDSKNKSIDNNLDSTNESKRSTRRTKRDDHLTEQRSESTVDVESKKKPPNLERFSPEIEVRRSKRQQSAKEKKNNEGPKSILKKSTHEQSTVYNISSSSTESPKGVKRSLTDSVEPSPKRTKSLVANTSHVSLRATPARMLNSQRVLLTAFPSEEVKLKLAKLGATVVTDVMECSVVLTKQIKRTFKLLCAVGLGRPIVGPSWVQACVDTRMIVDPWLYIIKDEAAEKRFHFDLHKTLTGKRNYLQGYNVSSTPSVQPNASEMKPIVECSGGTWKEEGPKWVCVSAPADRALWPGLRQRGASIVSTEFILAGVLRQELNIASNKL